MQRWFALSLSAFALSCGGASGLGGASVSGSIGGVSVPVVDVLGEYSTGHCNYSNSYGTRLSVAITNLGGTCSTTSQGTPKNAVVLDLVIGDINEASQPGPIPVGTYTSGDVQTAGNHGFSAAGFFITTDGAGVVNAAPAYSTGGTITLTAINGGAAKGSFDLMFGADEVKGTFDSADCPPTGTLPPWCD